MKPWQHAVNSAKKFGGRPEDYIAIHNWFDQTKAHIPDMRHRALLHNSFGIFLCESFFSVTDSATGQKLPFICNSEGKPVQIRDIGEQHVIEDLGFIPTLDKCFANLPLEEWMGGKVKEPEEIKKDEIPLAFRKLSEEDLERIKEESKNTLNDRSRRLRHMPPGYVD